MIQLFNRKNKKKGFTLIELIIVIAILAILAAVLIPSMASYMSVADESVADSNAQTAHMAMAAAVNMVKIRGAAVNTGETTATVDTAGSTITWGGAAAQDDELKDQYAELIGGSFIGIATFSFDSNGNLQSTSWARADGNTLGNYPVKPRS